MNPIDYVQRYIKVVEVILLIAALAGACVWWHHHNMEEQQIGYDKRKGEDAERDNAALKAALEQTAFYKAQLEKANEDSAKREEALQAAATASSAAVGSLQHTLTNIRNGAGSASADALRQTTLALTTVLGDCTSRYREVARAADGHANDVQTLMQAWPQQKPAP